MSVSDILSTALTGLNAAQAGMRTVSNNITNVNTPGYARERVSLQPGVSGGQVSGVIVGEPERIVDRYLETAVYTRSGDAGRAEVTGDYLDRLQTYLGQPSDESALPARIDAISTSATALTGASAGAQANAGFVADVTDAIDTLKQVAGDVDGLRADADAEVGATVKRINTLLTSISDLNDTVASLTGLNRSTAGPEDQRSAALQELSGLVTINTRTQPDGRVQIETASGTPLLDQRLRQLEYKGTGAGTSRPLYPSIDVRFADKTGKTGAATGETLDSPSVGGKLGGLIDLRDRQLPAVSERLGTLYGGLAQTLNAASNASTTVPAPTTLTGRATALAGSDRLGFTGAATVAVTARDGTLVASTRIDFDALGASATVDDAVAAINAGLGGAGTASFADGTLKIVASGTGNGVVVAQDVTAPSSRAGSGFSQYFGLNDLVRSDASMLTPSGFTTSDAHGFGSGQAAEIALRDASGNLVARHTLTGSGGSTYGALVAELNTSTLGRFGSFAMDDLGRVQFTPTDANTGSTISVLSDTTDRAGTGRSFTAIAGLTGTSNDLTTGGVRSDIAADPTRLGLAQLQSVPVGQKALGSGDRRGGTGYVDALSATVDLGTEGSSTIVRFASTVIGEIGSASARATDKSEELVARRDDAVARRDSVSGVNVDEELAQMVVLQNSYSAAARVVSAATEMYDTLLSMID